MEPGQEGTSTFIALATFALAEGGALTAVAKGERHDAIVLTIYGIIVLFTASWIVAMLRSTRRETPADGDSVEVRAYDSVSLRYGRITLAWTAILSFIMMFLALNQLLPNQTTRIEFNQSEVACEPLNYSDWSDPAGPIQKRMDKWIDSLAATARQLDEKEDFFLIKQKSVFPNAYKPFSLDVSCNPQFYLGERVAFLVHSPSNEYRPTYRQVPFLHADDAQTSTDTVAVADARDDEYLLLMIFVRDPKRIELPTKATVGLTSLTPQFIP